MPLDEHPVPTDREVWWERDAYFTAAARFASTSIVIFTSSPSTGPESRTLFQTIPYSLRSILKAVSKPAFSPRGVFTVPRRETGKVIERVMPCSVRFPVTSRVVPSFGTTWVLVKVRVGNFWTSKKSFDRRCSSRSLFEVSIEAALTVNSMLEADGAALSYLMTPSKSRKRPETLETKWRIEKLTQLWSTSTL